MDRNALLLDLVAALAVLAAATALGAVLGTVVAILRTISPTRTPANSISCNPVLAGEGPNALRSIKPSRLHHAARRRSRVAARGARAAIDQGADHRLLGCEHAFIRQPPDRRLRTAAARTRLDRGPHGHDRVSMVGRSQRALPRDRGRVRTAQGRCHCYHGRRSPGSKAGHISDTDRVPGGRRPGWRRLCRDAGTTGRQY